jgi:hypothetical protein
VKEIRIPEGVVEIGDRAFTHCGSKFDTPNILEELEAHYILARIADPEKELGDLWVNDDRLPELVNIYFPSTLRYMGSSVFASVRIDGIFLPPSMREVSQLPEFDETFYDMRYIHHIYLDDFATQAQVDALDAFFMEIENVGDKCWWFEDLHPYYAKAIPPSGD